MLSIVGTKSCGNIILLCVIILNKIFKELKFHDSNGSNGETPKKLSNIYLNNSKYLSKYPNLQAIRLSTPQDGDQESV